MSRKIRKISTAKLEGIKAGVRPVGMSIEEYRKIRESLWKEFHTKSKVTNEEAYKNGAFFATSAIAALIALVLVIKWGTKPSFPQSGECYQHRENEETVAHIIDVKNDSRVISYNVSYDVESINFYNYPTNYSEQHERSVDDFNSKYKKLNDCEKYQRLFYERLFNEVLEQRNALIKEKNQLRK